MTRQRHHQLRNKAAGFCEKSAAHGPPEAGKVLCSCCLDHHNRRGRVRQNRGERIPRPAVDLWAAVDWSQPDTAVAKLMRVGTSAVFYHRKKLGIVRRSKARWLEVDWSQDDPAIAQAMAVSEAAVRYQRKKHLRANENTQAHGAPRTATAPH